MSIQNRAGFISNGFGHIVTLDQHRIKGRDRSFVVHTDPLHEFGQIGKDRRRKAAPGGRLASRQANFAQSTGEAGYRIHQQQNFFALITEIFRDGRGNKSGFHALHRTFIGGRANNNRLGHAFWSKIVLDKFTHFAAAFADECHDRNVDIRTAHKHRKQGRFATTRRSKNAHALAFANGKHAIQ